MEVSCQKWVGVPSKLIRPRGLFLNSRKATETKFIPVSFN